MLADDVERRLLECATAGRALVIGPEDGSAKDPAAVASWPDSRTIEAESLVDLLTGRRQLSDRDLRAFVVIGARISGELDLTGLAVSCPIVGFVHCHFEQAVDVGGAQFVAFSLRDSFLPGLTADRVRTSDAMVLGGVVADTINLDSSHVGGRLSLQGARLGSGQAGDALTAWGLTVERDMWCNDLRAVGAVGLSGAHVGGKLSFDGAKLTNPTGWALNASHLVVGRDMSCSANFTAEGAVSLSSGQVHGVLDFRGASMTYQQGRALDASRITVDQDLLAGHGSHLEGTLCLTGARIGGSLDLAAASVTKENGIALDAVNLTTGKDLLFGDGAMIRGEVSIPDAEVGGIVYLADTVLTNARGAAFEAARIVVTRAVIGRALGDDGDGKDPERLTVTGMFSLSGASVGGDVDLDGARLTGVGGTALVIRDANVEGSVSCQNIKAQGAVDLARARISGSLWMDGAELRNMKHDAFDAGSLVVGDVMSFGDGFFADGMMNLTGAQVGGEVYFYGARMTNPDHIVLAGRRLRTDGDVRCSEGFHAVGEVRFVDAQIKGRLTFDDAVLKGFGSTTTSAPAIGLNLQRLEAAALILTPKRSPEGIVDLTDARVGAYSDTKESWPRRLRLRGFSYGQIDGAGVKDRLEWLARNVGRYAPGPYDELATAYRRAGHPDRARRIVLTKEKRRRSRLSAAGKAWNWFLWATVGYGYRTWLAAVWLVVLVGAGSLVFSDLHPNDVRPSGSETTGWNPVVYATDVVFPLIDLGQQSAWHASGPAAWWVLGLTVGGWLLVTAVGAGLTKALSRD